MTSRSDMIPAISPPSITGKAPIRHLPSKATASATVASRFMVATSLPLFARIAAIVMPASVIRVRVAGVDSPTDARQREACPRQEVPDDRTAPERDPPRRPRPERHQCQRTYLRRLGA